MKIENGKEEKIKEINEKLNPVAKYTYGEDSGYPNGFNFDQTEVTTEELLYIQVEQARQQLLISKIFFGVFIAVFVVLPIIACIIVL